MQKVDEEEDEGQEEVKQEEVEEEQEMQDVENMEEVGEGGGSRDGGGAARLCTSCRTLFSLFFFFPSQAVLTREERIATRKHLASFTEPIKADFHQKNDFAN